MKMKKMRMRVKMMKVSDYAFGSVGSKNFVYIIYLCLYQDDNRVT